MDYEAIQDDDKKKDTELRSYLEKLNKLKDLFYWLELSEMERKLLNNKILIVEGKSGIGKTQLFANEAISTLNANENALLVIGSDCKTLRITKFTDWTGLLEYSGDSVQGEYYVES